MQYDLNQLRDPTRFQQLVNAILTARFGEDARLTPLQGVDGGTDGETAPSNPYMEFRPASAGASSNNPLVSPPRPGRYLFQAKYHRTGDQRLSDLRSIVVREFRNELSSAVLRRHDREDVNYYFLVTNVPASKESIRKVDELRSQLLSGRRHLHADIYWRETITSWLDWSPTLWVSFAEIFPGRVPPFISRSANTKNPRLSRIFDMALKAQFERDQIVKFQQIELEKKLLDLFVDLDAEVHSEGEDLFDASMHTLRPDFLNGRSYNVHSFYTERNRNGDPSALELLIDDNLCMKKMLLEGGPGQGKSTVTQMAAQVYREKLLGTRDSADRDPTWSQLCQLRFPIRLELRSLAQALIEDPTGTLEQFIVRQIAIDAGGVSLTVEDLHEFLENSSVILLLDGLDEIGSDSLRDDVLDTISRAIRRFEDSLRINLRVVLTTRPPAVAGRREQLDGYTRVIIAPMNPTRIDDYVDRWLKTQIKTPDEHKRINQSFQDRRVESHVDALARNPMQLSVLLQFIKLKGEAFPDRRAELYREYFKIVIDRDVEKSPQLSEHRELVESLHAFLGFRLHGVAEIDQGSRTVCRSEILALAGQWFIKQGYPESMAVDYFDLGEERFGLIVAVSGEGETTRYGFEVQPIQEYFAASYISDHLAGIEAHDIFAHLVDRNYWREVALFLAGLRRPNEKADLISRARECDDEAPHPWRQNGRSIVLQLLREGVFSQPQNVLSEATKFVTEVLGLNELRFKPNPDLLIETLLQISRAFPTKHLCDRIAMVAKECEQSEDRHALALIHRLAAMLLPTDQYVNLVLGYAGNSSEARAMVRISCPYEARVGSAVLLETLAQNPNYWKDMPPPTSARDLWRSAIHHGIAIDISYPKKMHSSLVLQFAVDHQARRRNDPAVMVVRGQSPLAVWRLMQNSQILRTAFVMQSRQEIGRGRRAIGPEREYQSRAPVENVIYQGLSPQLKRCIHELICASDQVVAAMASGEDSLIVAAMDSYIGVITDHLADYGISGWVACRCGIEMVQADLSSRRELLKDQTMEKMVQSLAEFYDGRHVSLRYGYFGHWYPFRIPVSVRLRHGERPRRLGDVIVRVMDGSLSDAQQRRCSWLADTPLPGSVIADAVEAKRHELSTVLKFIGDRIVIGGPGSRRLKVQDTRRILGICRSTNDQRVLAGASTVLLNSRFSKIARADVIARMLAAGASDQFVSRVLNVSRRDLEQGDSQSRKARLALSDDVSRLVLDDPDRYPFRVVSRAAGVMADMDRTKDVPLFGERQDLIDDSC